MSTDDPGWPQVRRHCCSHRLPQRCDWLGGSGDCGQCRWFLADSRCDLEASTLEMDSVPLGCADAAGIATPTAPAGARDVITRSRLPAERLWCSSTKELGHCRASHRGAVPRRNAHLDLANSADLEQLLLGARQRLGNGLQGGVVKTT